MTDSGITAERPLHHVSSWKVFGVFCLVSFLVLLGVLFIPWDVQAPDDSDLHYTPPTLDAGKNAFTGLEAAGVACVTRFPKAGEPERLWTDLIMAIGSKSEKWDPAFADEVLKANEASFIELEKGLACERYASPMCQDFNTLLPWLQRHKRSTQLLCLKSKRAQLVGDPVAAAKSATQAWRLGRLVTDDANGLVEWLVGIACQSIGLARMNEVISDAKTPEQVLRDLLAQLDGWHPQGIIRGCKQAMQEEYRGSRKIVDECRRGNAGKFIDSNKFLDCWGRIPYSIKPNMMARLMVPLYRNTIENADRIYAKVNLDYPGKPKYPVTGADETAIFVGPNGLGKVLFFSFAPTSDRVISKKCYIQAYVASLRLKIALRLYEQKHGQLPDNLTALVPEYLNEVPQDPYDGNQFRYSKAGRKIWTIGFDLIDHGGNLFRDEEMRDSPKACKSDVGIRLGTREMKPTPAPPPAAPGSKPEENPF
jgi:hypothetical protein